jgi:hypothetical protein
VGTPGIIGLGPATGSVIFNLLDGAPGSDPVADNIFAQNKSTPHFITTLLGRSTDPTDPFPGSLTIGEVLPGFEAVTQQPKLQVTRPPRSIDQHWMALLDEDGVVVNGKKIQLPDTIVEGTANKKKLTAVFDNGFSLPQVPKFVTVVGRTYARSPVSVAE